MILLDTNVVVAFLNGNNLILKNIKEEINRIALSSLVVAELDYAQRHRIGRKKTWRSYIDSSMSFKSYLLILNVLRYLVRSKVNCEK
jgi:predicted nucleic acid-binding protein